MLIYDFDAIASALIADIMIDTQEYSDNKEEYSKNKIKSYLLPKDYKDCDLIYEVIRDNVEYFLKVYSPIITTAIENHC